ncbi:MAG: DUF2490 domain-containing protein [Mucilaginibacter polytrichastri]|nr:DUF2490 domain-containing protein [Mucilaginibacter polytrichastri]
MFTSVVRFLLALSFFLLYTSAFAQNNRFMTWGAFFNTTKLGNSKWSFQFDGQLRSTGDIRDINQIMVRPALLYNFNAHHNLGIGYGFVPSHQVRGNVSGLIVENRIFQQYIFKQRIHATTVDHRFRTEERFIGTSFNDNGTLRRTGNRFSGRLRYNVRAIMPLMKTDIFRRGAFVSLQDEIFANVVRLDHVNGKVFDQNRAYTSIGYRFSKKFDAEVGYMHQFILGGNNVRQQNNHIIQAAFYTRF